MDYFIFIGLTLLFSEIQKHQSLSFSVFFETRTRLDVVIVIPMIPSVFVIQNCSIINYDSGFLKTVQTGQVMCKL